MPIIALLTDFGLNDNFVGVMKGVILGINPKTCIVDLTHGIRPHDIFGAAFLLKGSFRYFPKGTVFLVVVDPGVGSGRKPIVIRTKNYYFVGPDNGILSLAAKEDGIKEIAAIENKRYFLKTPISNTFHGRDIFAPAAGHISKGKRCKVFGQPLHSIKKVNIPAPVKNKKTLRGKVIYIDRFGNLVTNIGKDLFERFTKNRRFEIKIKRKKINSIAASYLQAGPGKPLAIFGSFNLLEISVNQGRAESLFHAKRGVAVSIAAFKNKQ